MNPSHDKKLAAMAALVARTGATQMQVRYSDDEQPVVWFVVAIYPNDRWETGAGHDATQAAGRLLEALIDGGVCTHCQRPTAFDPDTIDDTDLEAMSGGQVCWYLYDPELATYRRGCE